MQESIALEVLAAVSDKGFSLDELVHKTQRLFEEQGLAGFVSLVLSLVDERIAMNLLTEAEGFKPAACCNEPSYRLLDRLTRTVRTSIGKVSLQWRRMQCRCCGKTLVPLREFLGLMRYQSKTVELERVVAEVVADQSYRRTSRHLRLIGQIPVPKSTAHRWVMQSPCDQLPQAKQKLQVLMADATGYKRRPTQEQDNQGSIRLALGIDHGGNVKPLGVWTEQSWEDIAGQLKSQADDGQTLARLLVSDGEPGLPQNIGPLADDQQRCHWHMIHDLDVRMRNDHAPKKVRRQMQKELAGLLEVQLPAQDVQPVSAEDSQQLQQTVQSAEAGIVKLIDRLARKGYRQAARYVAQAKSRLFTYVRLWMEHGLVNPRVSSFIERLMREVARRLKRLAFGWSRRGAAKMARIILKRFASAAEWDRCWQERMRLNEDNVILVLRGIKTVGPSQPLGR